MAPRKKNSKSRKKAAPKKKAAKKPAAKKVVKKAARKAVKKPVKKATKKAAKKKASTPIPSPQAGDAMVAGARSGVHCVCEQFPDGWFCMRRENGHKVKCDGPFETQAECQANAVCID